ncbi:inactive phospholipase C-like protein 2 isoform X2 [Hemitrygon akajei]|uniref:inactive phospholipase C-like protein 2 isoform X2 n=1 Tax=Hemitrygon akajei TaxID=2704970 RepID=UPI003BF97A30
MAEGKAERGVPSLVPSCSVSSSWAKKEGVEAVSNGDCVGEEPVTAAIGVLPSGPRADTHTPSPAAAPSQDGKPGIPRRSSIIKDGNRQRRERKKTVSFSSMPTEKKISSASDCINSMIEGSELKKIRSNSRVYHRYFLLDADMQSLRWDPSKKESDKAKIDITSIKEVRTGRNTEMFRTNAIYDHISEDCAFSIIYGENYESLDLVANSADVANIWVTGLRYLISYGKHTLDMIVSSHNNMRASWLSDVFATADTKDVGYISFNKAVQLIKSLNSGLKNTKIELKFKELHKAKGKTGTDVFKEELIEVYHELCTRPEIYFLLVQFSSNKEFLETKDLMMFLEAEQGMPHVTEQVSMNIIQKYEPSKEGQENGWLSLDGFTKYLISPECHIFDPEHKKVCQDMTQPVSHYYINASHNTYLIEDQFRGPSDITGYIRALKMGCRSVEVDAWDGPDNEPIIYTGHTMTSQIVFHRVIDVINKYAFVASEYPLILCLENHCSIKQQKVMIQHMKKILGDKLYTEPPSVEDNYLPSPEVLKYKILLKTKKLPENCTGLEGDITDEDEGAEMSRRTTGDNIDQQNVAPKRFLLCKELSDMVAVASFKELCGVSPVSNLIQCFMALSTLLNSDNIPIVVLNLKDDYPSMEPQGMIPEVLKKVVTAYEVMIQTTKALLENGDGVCEKIMQCQRVAMEFHENLNNIGVKEGLKGRKLQKAVESFTWNITILKGQADLLKNAKIEALENLKQIHYAAVSCGLNKPGTGNTESSKPRRSLEAIPEKESVEVGAGDRAAESRQNTIEKSVKAAK